MDYAISKYSEDFEDHIDQIARLKTLNWGLDFDIFRSYVKWNYIDRPHSKPTIYFVRNGEEIVAMRGLYETTWQLKCASASFKASCAADLLILKEHRKKGIYKELVNFVRRDLDAMGAQYEFSFNPAPLVYMISLSMGWKSIGEIETIKKQFQKRGSNAIALAKKIAGPYARKLLREAGLNTLLKFNRKERDNSQRIDTIYQNPRTKLPPHVSLENKPRPAEMAILVNNTLPINKITLKRDETFFRWRYNNPLSKYLFLYLDDGDLKGYLVLQSHIYSAESIGSHNIFELEATSSSIKIELLNALMSVVNSGSISIWANMLDRDSYNFLISHGFKGVNSTTSGNDYYQRFLIRAIGKHDDQVAFQGLNLLDVNNWDLKMIYFHDH